MLIVLCTIIQLVGSGVRREPPNPDFLPELLFLVYVYLFVYLFLTLLPFLSLGRQKVYMHEELFTRVIGLR